MMDSTSGPVAHAVADRERAPFAAWYMLFILTLVSFLSYVDRNVLLLVAEPIKADLGLSDTQLGLLQGTGIALFTACASYPLGWLADRFDRRLVLAGCIVVWSTAVAACGLAGSFSQLFIAGGMVAAGEAGIAPIVYALIPLVFAGAQRQLANSLFSVTAVGGGALAMALAGQLVGLAGEARPLMPAALQGFDDWRLAFFLAAGPAPLMVFLVLTLRLPKRAPKPQEMQQTQAAPPEERIGMLAYMQRHWQAMLCLYFGSAMAGATFAAIGPWLAVISARIFKGSPEHIGAGLGLGQITSAGAGFLLSLLLTRFFKERYGLLLPVRGLWIGGIGMALSCLAFLGLDTANGVFIFYAIYGTFLTFGIMLYPTALQSVMPLHLMGRAISLQFILTMFFAATVTPFVGFLSDRLLPGGNGIMYAMIGVAIPAALLSSLLFRLCEQRYFARTAADAARIVALEAKQG